MQVVRKYFLPAILLAVATISFGQKQKSNSVAPVVNAIAKSNVYEVSYTVGYAGTISKQYERLVKLSSLATEQELLAIAAQNKNAVVRLYALQALKQKKIRIPQELLRQFQNDHTMVKMLKGCIGDQKRVNVLFQQDLKSSIDFSN